MVKKKKKKKKRTIGAMSNSRLMWDRKPQTQVVSNGKRKRDKDRKKVKEKLKKGDYDV